MLHFLQDTRRLGVLDLGSGTARLVVYAYAPGRYFHQVDELREPVRLGEGLAKGSLSPEALKRGARALRLFADFARAVGLAQEEVVALATSALRDGQGGEALLEEAARLGLPLRVISGEEEARYGVLAVANSLPFSEAWVVDQGGGSAQVSRMEGRRFAGGRALPLGVLRLKEAFWTQDPPSAREVQALRRHVRAHLKDLPSGTGLPLVAMGGTVRALARLHQKQSRYPLDLLHGYFLPLEALKELKEALLALPLKRRKELEGLQPDRAETVPVGAVFYEALLETLGLPGLHVSGQGIREGAFYERFLPPPHLLQEVRGFFVEALFHRYPFDPLHRDRVAALALALFDGLAPLHRLGPAARRLLHEAVLLHDIGMHVGYLDHHKHGAYLVLSEPLPGLTHKEQALLALLVRYHRRGKPEFGALKPLFAKEDKDLLLKLSALLRLAEHLERPRTGRVRGVRLEIGERVRLRLEASEEPWVEVLETEKQAGLFAKAFGRGLEVVWP
jgi:exopolyphosphatase/guanosine-5'-triphosphate,3'-diphosphate pyrophosphatase